MLKGSCKKLFAGIMILSLIGSIFPITPIVQAESLPSYYERAPSEREKALLSARDFAYQYLKNSSEEPLWKNKFPYISGEKFFYTANDEIPSYIEFKVSTSGSPDSGFIIVNLDGNDVEVPIASPSGKTPSEALNIRFNKNHNNDGNKKLYYFSPFDQWMVDENGNAETLNPNNQEDEVVEKSENNSEISLRNAENEKNPETILTEKGKQKQNTKFTEMKKNAVEFVNSREMRSIRGSETRSVRYVNPGMSDKLLPGGQSSSECVGATPCYGQFDINYVCQNPSCYSGCVPVAFAIAYGYHDRHKFPNLISGFAPMSNNWAINNMIMKLRGHMGTGTNGASCGGTTPDNMTKGIIYAQNQGYRRAKSQFVRNTNTSSVAGSLRREVNKNNPVLLITHNHAIVVWGYHSGNSKVFRMNMGWGNGFHAGYRTSDVDMNLDSIVYSSTTHPVIGYITISIDGR